MACVVELVRQDQQRTSFWTGGTTTEIAIYPKDAVYGRRDFLWRISSARVDAEDSVFTALPRIWRLIMVLEGGLTLQHEHHHNVRLEPFQQDAFAGDWVTRSKGRARDFNIMLARGCTGKVQAVSLEELSTLTISGEKVQEGGRNRKAVLVVYSVDGRIVADVGNDRTWSLNRGDALLLTTDHSEVMRSVDLSNLGNTQIHAVLATIWYDEPPRRACRRSILP
ncbi:MAG: HutD family protein [Caldiserica bacterium]|nr:HutD family protein [Caldisericota bacterium]